MPSILPWQIVIAVLGVLVLLCALAVVALITMRLARRARDREAAELAASVRPLVLSASIADDDAEVAEIAARLRRMPGRNVRMAAKIAANTMQGVRGETREALSLLLRELGMVERLITRTRDADPVLRAHAAEALGYVSDERVFDALAPLVDDPDPDVRITAVRALGRTGDERAAPLLQRALRSGVPPVVAATALLELGAETPPEGHHDADAGVRRASAVLAGYTMGPHAVDDLLAAMWEDPESIVREQAARSLARLGSRRSIDTLADVALNDRDPRVQTAAAAAIAAFPRAAAERQRQALLQHPSVDVRRAVQSIEEPA